MLTEELYRIFIIFNQRVFLELWSRDSIFASQLMTCETVKVVGLKFTTKFA